MPGEPLRREHHVQEHPGSAADLYAEPVHEAVAVIPEQIAESG